MKHRLTGKKLGRNHHQRQALFRTQARSLFTHGHICTTQAKVQALLPLVTKIFHLCQKSDLSSARRLYAIFQDRKFVNKIIKAVKLSSTNPQSDFLKIRRLKQRQGDNALIVKVEFINPYNLEVQPKPVKKSPATSKKEPVVNKKK